MLTREANAQTGRCRLCGSSWSPRDDGDVHFSLGTDLERYVRAAGRLAAEVASAARCSLLPTDDLCALLPAQLTRIASVVSETGDFLSFSRCAAR